jgi:hypothetical protein
MGNEFHDQAASDIVFIVIETPHKTFRREGDNLRTVVDLTLKEVLFIKLIHVLRLFWDLKNLLHTWMAVKSNYPEMLLLSLVQENYKMNNS